MKKVVLILAVFLFLSFVNAEELIFYETFDDEQGILDNQGTIYGAIDFVNGVLGNAADMTGGSKKVCYPLEGNFDDTNGTLEFWVKPPYENHLGFFDIGYLSRPNSWGIFKNVNFLIMEVKGNTGYDQAWSIDPFIYDSRWHHVAAVWYKTPAGYINFKVFLDGRAKDYFDGNENNDINYTTTTEFCVGWNGWYGYSDSFFDEFKIFDYVKSDEEVMDDYLELVNNTFENLTEKECVMYKPESTGPVRMNCTGLYVNNRPYYIKGAGYQPIPIGQTADIPGGADVIFNTPEIYNRDFPLLEEMHANTIRTWAPVTNISFLDAAHEHGIKVIMGFWINCNENYGDPTIRQKYIANFTEYVNTYKDHPAVLMWILGNENNLDYCSSHSYVDDFYDLGNELARVAWEVEGEDYHPVGIVNGYLFHIGIPEYNSDDETLNYTDFWASNAYVGNSFTNFLTQYTYLSGKPLYISEYGIDALNNSNYQEYESVQAEWDIALWRDIKRSHKTIGATVMEYSDEWWKAGSTWSHDYGGYGTPHQPDGYANEEWWGIMRVSRNYSGVDIMEPRQVYHAFKREFKKLPIHMEPAGMLDPINASIAP
ncbi:MAG: LamG-like jellyroll fold domain-containing protein [Nanoarchaeota archaeon]